MSQPFRLATGGAIDRTRPLEFELDGRRLSGFAGDTVASALLANGVHLVARSFKEHRPRGIVSAGSEEPNALLEFGTGGAATPSVRATCAPLVPGLVARSQHGWPGVGFDLLAATSWFHALLPAGFYNKTFLWPGWETFEPAIRRMAGLGRVPKAEDPDRYAWRNTQCDLLVAGAGAAGLVAAHTAARSGARVLLVESDRELGGGLLWRHEPLAGTAPRAWVDELAEQLAHLPNVRIVRGATVVGAWDHGVFAALEELPSSWHGSSADSPGARLRQRWWRIRSRQAIVATGAVEQPLVFPHNDRPGILLADSARHYLHRYAVAAGRRAVVATNNDSAYRVALELAGAGIAVVALVDTRAAVAAELADALRAAGIALHAGSHVASTSGRRRVSGVELVDRDGRRRRLACDTLLVSGGWNPAAQLWAQAGGRLRFDPERAAFLPDGELAALHPVGAAAGRFELRSALEHAVESAALAVEAIGRAPRPDPRLLAGIAPERAPAPVGAIGCASDVDRDRAWVDFAHDVTAADVDLAARESFVSVEHLKRYTTTGMAFDQGRTSNLNAIAILGERTGRAPGDVGTTKFRQPVVPVALGAIAGGRLGEFLRPTRLLPSHDRQLACGAQMEDFGLWKRPALYRPTGARAGETEHQAVAREMTAVRTAAGLFEASPLGKLVVRGPDAARFLDFLYATPIADLAVGRVRYGAMLTEKGIVLDDGVTTRWGDDEYWVGTSSANALRIAAWIEEWLQCQFPDWRVVTTDLTSVWATVTVAGPRARDLVGTLPLDVDLSPAAFPHMHARSGTLAGAPCRICRVSFTGELSYEISVPADRGAALWDALLAAGAPFGAQPFGVEALLALRIEKGFLHVGADTDGTTVPDDVGLAPLVAKKSGDFVGRRSLTLAENVRADRFQLVGLRLIGDPRPFVAGAHLVGAARFRPPVETEGYLTSACWSPTLGAHVGLGMLARGRSRLGETVSLFHAGRTTRAEVVSPVHLDPKGERLRA